MNQKLLASVASLICTFIFSASAEVTHWRVVKGAYYQQSADNTPDATTTNWGVFGIVETELPGDAASVVIEGGNISGSIAYVLEGSEWELGADYPSQAALDAVFPSDANYSIILSGGTLGSVTQNFHLAADAYPNTPYLTGADYSDSLALEALEPFEINWNNAGTTTTVSLQVNTGAELDEGDTIFEIYSNNFTAVELPWNLFEANSNYNGFIDFANATNFDGFGGFETNGDVSFNTSLAFNIDTVNTAVESDDFSGGTNSMWIPFLSEVGKGFTPTNDVLEFFSDSSPDGDSTAWIYDTDALAYTQDWSVAVDIANFLDESSFTGGQEAYFTLVAGSDDLQNLMLLENYIEQDYREVFFGVDTNGVEDVLTLSVPTAEQQMALKISFDAKRELLTSAYSLGGDYTVITNFSTADWGFADSDTFLTALSFGSAGLAIAPGEVYADNFRIYDGRVLSNEVDIVELEFLHSYGDGSIFTEINEIKVEADTSLRIISMDVTTSGGDQFNVPLDWVDGATNFWDVDIVFPFAEPWNPANDGDWVVTFGLNNGTFQSTVIPFTLEDGTTPIPNFYNMPEFIAPSPDNGLATSSNTFSFAWQPAPPNALFVSVDEIVNGNEIGDLAMTFTNGLSAESLALVGITNAQPISVTTAGPFIFGKGFHRMRINEGSGHIAYNADGIPYIAVKQNESDIIFTITPDVDGDNMDDDWEIEFFGGTNVVDGGADDDFDMDGFSNVEEFIAGINPTNSGSVFAVEEPGPSPSGFVINWNSVEGRKYRVYWAKQLGDVFESVTPGYLPHPQNSYTDTVHTVEGCGFYYIDVQLDD